MKVLMYPLVLCSTKTKFERYPIPCPTKTQLEAHPILNLNKSPRNFVWSSVSKYLDSCKFDILCRSFILILFLEVTMLIILSVLMSNSNLLLQVCTEGIMSSKPMIVCWVVSYIECLDERIDDRTLSDATRVSVKCFCITFL